MMETLNSGLSKDSKEEKDMQFKNNLKPLQKNTRIRLNVFQSQISPREHEAILGDYKFSNLLEESGVVFSYLSWTFKKSYLLLILAGVKKSQSQ